MNIKDAAERASQTGQAITLIREGMRINLLPTNTTSMIIESLDNGRKLTYWQPTLDDLVSDNWKVSSQFKIEKAPSDAAGPKGVPGLS